MKVHLIKKDTIENFIKNYPNSRKSFEDWFSKLKEVNWLQAGDIKSTYNSADLLGNGSNRVIFNIGGNNYRMICKYAFGDKQIHLFICWIGSHKEYDKICNNNEQYAINIF